MKALLLVDISNVYYCVKNQFNARISYEKFLAFLASKNYNIAKKIAYGSNEQQHIPFQDFMRHLGFLFKTKELTQKGADWDVGIAVDAMRYYTEYEAIIFATSDGDMLPCFEALRDKVRVVVIGARISMDLKRCAHEVFEITPNLFLTEESNAASSNSKSNNNA